MARGSAWIFQPKERTNDEAATAREQRADQKFEQGARQADRGTRPAREDAARLITQGNAIKAGRPIPGYATTGK